MVSLVGLWRSWAGRLFSEVLPSVLPVLVICNPLFVLVCDVPHVMGIVRVVGVCARVLLVRIWICSFSPRTARSVVGFLSG